MSGRATYYRGKIEAAEKEANDALRRVEETRRKLERLEALPVDDPCEDGDVLKIIKRFDSSPDRVYTYAAVRVNGRWFLTGKFNSGQTWLDLIETLCNGGYVVSLRRMRKGERLL